MLATGAIVVDHKIGKKKMYAVSGKGSDDGIIKPNIIHLTPAQRFDYVGTLVDMVATGISPSVMVTGLSGIGKTFLVKTRLEANGLQENMDFLMVTGHATPLGLYRLLSEHRNQRLVFDDCDSIFHEADSVNLLKAALDSYNVRKVCWHSSRLPDDLEPSFEFEGQIIFVSNLTADRIDEAVKSRTFVIDLQMSRKEICEYLWTLIDDIEPAMPHDEKAEILTELELRNASFEQFNIRTFIKACRVYRGAKASDKNWKEMLTVLI